MSLPDATRWIDRNMQRLVLGCVVGTCLCFALFGYQQLQVRGAAAQGQMAREIQVRRQPISLKMYVDAYRRGVISAAELECFRDWRACPPPKTP